jgi:hypothetical protein
LQLLQAVEAGEKIRKEREEEARRRDQVSKFQYSRGGFDDDVIALPEHLVLDEVVQAIREAVVEYGTTVLGMSDNDGGLDGTLTVTSTYADTMRDLFSTITVAEPATAATRGRAAAAAASTLGSTLGSRVSGVSDSDPAHGVGGGRALADRAANAVYDVLVAQSSTAATWLGSNAKLTRLKLSGGFKSVLKRQLTWEQFGERCHRRRRRRHSAALRAPPPILSVTSTVSRYPSL